MCRADQGAHAREPGTPAQHEGYPAAIRWALPSPKLLLTVVAVGVARYRSRSLANTYFGRPVTSHPAVQPTLQSLQDQALTHVCANTQVMRRTTAKFRKARRIVGAVALDDCRDVVDYSDHILTVRNTAVIMMMTIRTMIMIIIFVGIITIATVITSSSAAA